MTGIDPFLDALREALIATEGGVPELTGTPGQDDGNVQVFHLGNADPSDDIRSGMNRCKGVHVLIYDIGGDSEPDDANAPVINVDAVVELYVDPTKRDRRRDPSRRLPGEIRDDIMQTLHLNESILRDQHNFYDTTVRSYRPIADPEFVVYRITVRRSVYLHQ